MPLAQEQEKWPTLTWVTPQLAFAMDRETVDGEIRTKKQTNKK